MLWDSVLWDFVLWDSVLWDFVLWDSVPDSRKSPIDRAMDEQFPRFLRHPTWSLNERKMAPEPVPRSQIRRGTPIFFGPEISPNTTFQITNFDGTCIDPAA